MSVNLSLMAKLGHLFKSITGTVPAAASAGTRNGTAINRRQNGAIAQGCTLFVSSGAETGAPSARTLDAKIQDSADGSTNWADYIPPDQTTVAAAPQIVAASSSSEVDVNLAGAKAYIRVVEVLAFTAGTTPTLGAQSSVSLYGFDRTPQ